MPNPWPEQIMYPPAHLSEKFTIALKLINKTTNKLILDITLSLQKSENCRTNASQQNNS